MYLERALRSLVMEMADKRHQETVHNCCSGMARLDRPLMARATAGTANSPVGCRHCQACWVCTGRMGILERRTVTVCPDYNWDLALYHQNYNLQSHDYGQVCC